MVPDRIELVPAGGIVEALRAVKDAGEVERIRAAAALADAVYGTAARAGAGRPHGARGGARARERDAPARRRGAELPVDRRVRPSAARCRTPCRPTSPIPRGTLVTLDIGARLDGYCSDCTRTWATGELPDDLAEAYALVLRAQQAALDAVRPGPTGREVDAVAREIIEEAGHGEHFGHGLGHGVGLEVHEAPRLARTGDSPLVAGNVVTVEPGVYLPGRGGVRIEDLVVVTEDGRDVLSGTTKDLLTVD